MLLNLDIAGLGQELDALNGSYTDLGLALRGLPKGVRSYLDSLKALLPGLDLVASVGNPLEDPSMSSIFMHPREISKLSEKVQEVFDAASSNAGQASRNVFENRFREAFNRIENALWSDSYQTDMSSVDAAIKQTQREGDKAVAGISKRQVRLSNLLEEEIAKARAEVKKQASNLPGGLSKGLVGALVGTIFLNYQNMNRKRAEAGEMANVFERSVDGMGSREEQRATSFFSKWAEYAQRHWGVGRKEVQSAAALMVDAGFRVEDYMSTVGKDLGEAGSNKVIFALAVGKHFDYSTSDSMDLIVSLVRDYGESLDGAISGYTSMLSAGERSGVGVRNFTKIVMSSMEPLSTMGANGRDVALVVERLLGYYKEMGLSSQYAGQEVAGVVTDLFTAFSNLSDQLLIVIGRDIFKGDLKAMEVRERMKDGLMRVSRGEDEGFLESLVRSVANNILRGSSTSRSDAIHAIQTTLNVDNRTATIFHGAWESISKGRHLADISKSSRNELKNAFVTEGKRMSGLLKTKYDLIESSSKMGEGLMGVLASLVSIVVVGLRSLYFVSKSIAMGTGLSPNLMLDMYDMGMKIYGHMGESWDTFFEGGKETLGVLGREFKETFTPVVEALDTDVWPGRLKGQVSKKGVLGNALDFGGKSIGEHIHDLSYKALGGILGSLEAMSAARKAEFDRGQSYSGFDYKYSGGKVVNVQGLLKGAAKQGAARGSSPTLSTGGLRSGVLQQDLKFSAGTSVRAY